MSFTLTEEQAAIVHAAKTTNDNILMEALAGAAKTSTLEMIAKAITGKPMLCIAFNKRIAEEMQRRMPSLCKCMTLNAVGHRAWAQGLGRNVTLNSDKLYELLKEEVADLGAADREYLREVFSETLSALKIAKAFGYIPIKSYSNIQHLHTDRERFFDDLETFTGDLFEPVQISLIERCLDRSIKQAFDGIIDFDDQIYMPTLFHGVFPQFPLTLCDEVQDFSILNQKMVAKMVGNRRIIGVGDPYQSIYAFRGADKNAMQAMRDQFSMRTMQLSISFRCPKSIVELARRRAPHMQYPAWAKPGQIRELEQWEIKDIPDGSFVICRNNAPLFYLALQFLKKGRGVNLVGSQLSKGLIRILKKLGPDNASRETVTIAADKWLRDNEKRARTDSKKEIVREKHDCLMVFIRSGERLKEMVAFAETVFASKGNVSLMTGHKSKGLENENIFHLDSHLICPPWLRPEDKPHVYEQELNLQYVIDTRSKDNYTYITTKGLMP